MFFPVVTSQEMHRIEQLAVKEGESEEAFMAEAGRVIAAAAFDWIEKGKLSKRVALLVGKGNNGGDAYAAGVHLLQKGIQVRALSLYPPKECSKLNQKFHSLFLQSQGIFEHISEGNDFSFEGDGLILDGFLGTGFKGEVEMQMGAAIDRANASRIPILAIDIPSGLNGTSGEAGRHAIFAHETISLGLLKSGFFLRSGWNHVGRLRLGDFGLPARFVKQAQALAQVPQEGSLHPLLPAIVRNRHKYQAGYVVGFSGSKIFKGAPKLAGLSALRSGAGIVRVFHWDEIGETPYSLICQKWNQKEWNEELKRAGALFLGPGIGKSVAMRSFIKKEIKKWKQPMVIDADAIQDGIDYPEGAVLTPHRGEVLRLLKISKEIAEEELLARCQKWASKTKCVLILKGAPTWIFSEKNLPVIVPRGDPGMAKAGTGDVLTGIIAALLAQRAPPLSAAVLGVSVHAAAGELAAQKRTSYGVIAEDLISAINLYRN